MAKIKEIDGFEGYYVTDAGKVMRYINGNFVWLKTHEDKYGYLCLTFRLEGKIINLKIHRLVAQSFIPIPEKYKGIPIEELDIHHISNEKKDNRVSNLMWLTKKEHALIHSKEKEKKYKGVGNPFYGKHHTNETKEKLKESTIGKYVGENNPMYGKKRKDIWKKVVQIDAKTNEPIMIFFSVRYAAESVNASESCISNTCLGRMSVCKGYKWAYLE